ASELLRGSLGTILLYCRGNFREIDACQRLTGQAGSLGNGVRVEDPHQRGLADEDVGRMIALGRTQRGSGYGPVRGERLDTAGYRRGKFGSGEGGSPAHSKQNTSIDCDGGGRYASFGRDDRRVIVGRLGASDAWPHGTRNRRHQQKHFQNSVDHSYHGMANLLVRGEIRYETRAEHFTDRRLTSNRVPRWNTDIKSKPRGPRSVPNHARLARAGVHLETPRIWRACRNEVEIASHKNLLATDDSLAQSSSVSTLTPQADAKRSATRLQPPYLPLRRARACKKTHSGHWFVWRRPKKRSVQGARIFLGKW